MSPTTAAGAVERETSWPESAPGEDEEHVASIVCGNSHLHWAFHNGLKNDFKPALFWRTPHLRSSDLDFELAHALSRHLPQFAHDFVFGPGNNPTSETAEKTATNRPKLSVYIISAVREQSDLLFRMWGGVPSRVYLIKGDDFFTAAEGRYDSMGIDRLAILRGAGELYGYPALVFDGGTATTYTAADSNGSILGGGIGPGFHTKFRSIKDYTDALPLIGPEEVLTKVRDAVEKKAPLRIFAQNTNDAIVVDILQEFALKTRLVITKWLKSVGKVKKKATSGTAKDEKQKRNEKRVVLVCGGDGELLTQLLQKNAGGILETKDVGALLPDLSGCHVIHQKHLAHYGIASSLMKRVKESHLKQKTKKSDQQAELEVEENEKFLGQRVAKVFDVEDADGDVVFRGSIVGLQRSADPNDTTTTKKKKTTEDWFLIKYDDGDREHVNLKELQEMLELYREHGEKELGVKNSRKARLASKKSVKKAAASESEAKSSDAERPIAESPIPTKTKESETKLTSKKPQDSKVETETPTLTEIESTVENVETTPKVPKRGRYAKAKTNEKTNGDDENVTGPASGRKRRASSAAKPESSPPPAATPTPTKVGAKKRGRPKRSETPTSKQLVPTPKKKAGSPSEKPKDYINKRVAKKFEREIFFGSIVRYDDGDSSDDPAFWGVNYDDGDAEDFEEKDLLKALKLYDRVKHDDPNPWKEVDNVEDSGIIDEMTGVENGSKSVDNEAKTTEENNEKQKDEDEEAPQSRKRRKKAETDDVQMEDVDKSTASKIDNLSSPDQGETKESSKKKDTTPTNKSTGDKNEERDEDEVDVLGSEKSEDHQDKDDDKPKDAKSKLPEKGTSTQTNTLKSSKGDEGTMQPASTKNKENMSDIPDKKSAPSDKPSPQSKLSASEEVENDSKVDVTSTGDAQGKDENEVQTELQNLLV